MACLEKNILQSIMYNNFFKKALRWSSGIVRKVFTKENVAEELCSTSICSRVGNGNPLQYSCLENPMDGGAWWAAVHGVAKSRTRLSDFTFTFHFHALEKDMATPSSVLACRIPGTGEAGRLLSTGSHRVGHNWHDLAAFVKINIFEYKTSISLLKFWKKMKLLSYGKILGE